MKHNTTTITLLIVIAVLVGCKKLVDVGLPPTQLSTGTVFQTDATAISALTSIYAQMVGSSQPVPYSLDKFTGIAGDEQINYSISDLPIATNTLQAPDAPTNAYWTLIFKIIYQANAVYEGCEASGTLSQSVKKQLMAEARFIRAFWNFYLVNLFGDIPLVTTTDYQINTTLYRSSSMDVYKLIIEDLQYAVSQLNDHYVALNSVSESTERIRPNKAAAIALLARAYLYSNNYTGAIDQASLVLANKSVYDTVSLSEVFRFTSKEAIWQLRMPEPTNSINTWEGTNYTLKTPPSAGSQNSSALSPLLLSSFEAADKRRAQWIGVFTDTSSHPNKQYHYPSKYKIVSSSIITESSTVLRIAELYLIRAEANANLGNLNEAIADLDVVRKRAGLNSIIDVIPNVTSETLKGAIYTERRKEFFAEWCHRWFDLKRSGKIDEVMVVASQYKGSQWDTNQKLWPIPLSETNKNLNLLPNNPGYN